MKQIRLLMADHLLHWSYRLARDYWSNDTVYAYVALTKSIMKDMEDEHKAST